MSRRLEAALVAASALALALPFLDKGFHVDEPFFLDRARDLLAGVPWVPRAWAQYNNNPPMILWLLAGAGQAAGEREWALRALLLPFDAAAAACLYLIFARFLAAPLPWALLVVASPAWTLNMGHLMAEKPAMAFLLASLYALLRGAERLSRPWLGASALLLSAALLSKYAALAAVPAAGWYLWRRAGPRACAAYLALAGAAPLLWLLGNALGGGAAVTGVARTLSGAAEGAWSRWPHRLRALLAFSGGLAVFPYAWPLLRPSRFALLAAGAAAALFLPALDSAPVRHLDRLHGAWLAAGAVAAGAAAWESRRLPAARLWGPWLLAALALAAGYWSVMARVLLFAMPPLALAAGSSWESRGQGRAAPLALAALAALLSLAAGWVDLRYAAAQRRLARELAEGPVAEGRTVWCGASLGLRHYLSRAGARPIESSEDWARVRPGDRVVLARTTSNVRPPPGFSAQGEFRRVESRLPLRLVSGFGGEGGFYSSISGFLPWSFSSEPVEEFLLLERR